MNRQRSLLTLAAAALLVVPLSACTMGAGSSGAMPPGPDSLSREESTTELDIANGAMDSSAADAGAGVAKEAPSSANAGKSVIQNGDISVTVGDPEAAALEVVQITEKLGGYVESQSVSAAGAGITANATLSVRVPAAKIDEAFAALAEVGEVTSQNRSSTDVTAEHVDLKARVAALKESVKRLTELMTDSASTGELIEAEAALSQRQQELDGLTAQLKALEGQVDESSIWVTLSTKSVVVPGGPTNFWDGLLAGIGSLSAAGAGALVLLGVLLPWLVLGGIIAAIVLLIVRAARRRGRKPAVDAPSADPTHTQAADPAHATDPAHAADPGHALPGDPALTVDPALPIDPAYPQHPGQPPHTPNQNW